MSNTHQTSTKEPVIVLNNELLILKLPDYIQEIFTNKTLHFQDKLEQISGIGYGTCRWGEPNKASTLALFDSLCILSEYLNLEELSQLLQLPELQNNVLPDNFDPGTALVMINNSLISQGDLSNSERFHHLIVDLIFVKS